MEQYDCLGVLGKGTYGIVLKCRDRETGQIVAIKKFKESDEDEQVRRTALREIRMLKQLKHENIVNLLDVFRRKGKLYLVFEHLDRSFLEDLESHPNGLDVESIKRMLYQLLRGVEYCHSQNVIHRDIKPENILISRDGLVKLCDFGFARTLAGPGGEYTDYVATRWYRSPELLVGDVEYGKPVDIWAIGCLVAECLNGLPLFPGDSDLDQLSHILKCIRKLTPRHMEIFSQNPLYHGIQFPIPREVVGLRERFSGESEEVLDFLEQCLSPDPNARSLTSELLHHPLFSDEWKAKTNIWIHRLAELTSDCSGFRSMRRKQRRGNVHAADEGRSNSRDFSGDHVMNASHRHSPLSHSPEEHVLYDGSDRENQAHDFSVLSSLISVHSKSGFVSQSDDESTNHVVRQAGSKNCGNETIPLHKPFPKRPPAVPPGTVTTGNTGNLLSSSTTSNLSVQGRPFSPPESSAIIHHPLLPHNNARSQASRLVAFPSLANDSISEDKKKGNSLLKKNPLHRRDTFLFPEISSGSSVGFGVNPLSRTGVVGIRLGAGSRNVSMNKKILASGPPPTAPSFSLVSDHSVESSMFSMDTNEVNHQISALIDFPSHSVSRVESPPAVGSRLHAILSPHQTVRGVVPSTHPAATTPSGLTLSSSNAQFLHSSMTAVSLSQTSFDSMSSARGLIPTSPRGVSYPSTSSSSSKPSLPLPSSSIHSSDSSGDGANVDRPGVPFVSSTSRYPIPSMQPSSQAPGSVQGVGYMGSNVSRSRSRRNF